LLNKINQYLDNQEDNMLSLLEEFVNTDSGTYDKKQVDTLGNKLKICFEKLGFVIEQVRCKEFGDCLVARINQHNEGKKILLVGHFDTVFPKGEANARPFKIIGKRAYGPGVGDMKSGLVTILYSLKTLKHIDYFKKPVSIILNSHEEIGSVYSRVLIRDESKTAGIVFNLEPARSNGALVTGRKGLAFLDIKIRGKAAHAGTEPEKGINANLELAHRIIELQKLNDFYKDKGLTINVNIISGGYARNAIPENATAKVDIRFIDEKDLAYLKKDLLKVFSKSWIEGTKSHFNIREVFPPMKRDKNVLTAYKLVHEAAECIKFDIKQAFTGGCSDAGFAAQTGTPTICGMGPIAGRAHSKEEYVEISSIKEHCKLLAISMIKFWEYNK